MVPAAPTIHTATATWGFRLQPRDWLPLARLVRDNPGDVVLGARVFFSIGGHDEEPTYRRFLRTSTGAQLVQNTTALPELFTDYDRALGEISRVLKPGGAFVCQTIVTRNSPPLWLRVADRILRFGYFKLDELKNQLDRLHMNITEEETSKVSYIFRAVKRNSRMRPAADLETASIQS